jgi:hypothetical protein
VEASSLADLATAGARDQAVVLREVPATTPSSQRAVDTSGASGN